MKRFRWFVLAIFLIAGGSYATKLLAVTPSPQKDGPRPQCLPGIPCNV